MKKLVQLPLFLLLIIAFVPVKALHFSSQNSTYQHLKEVNSQWANFYSVAPQVEVKFMTDADRIQYHLQLVEKHLRENTPANISAEARQNRTFLLDKLKAYAAEKQFPANTYHATRTPYFIDDFGVYCAVGFLIKESGNKYLAQKINNEQRFDYIKNIRTDGLAIWAENFGFTVDELAWIQPTYKPKTQFASLGEGTNGPITEMYNSVADGKLYFIGNFDSVNSLPCLNIGYYTEGNLNCLGNGIDGKINSLATDGKNIYAAGNFIKENISFPLAIFNGIEWELIQMPNLKSYVGKEIFVSKAGYKWLVVSATSDDKAQVLYSENSPGKWRNRASLRGIINDIENSADGDIIVGAFDEIVYYSDTQTDVRTIPAKNIALFKNNTFHAVKGEVSDTIFCAENINGIVYLGGHCINSENENNICLTQLMNDTITTVLTAKNFTSIQNAILTIDPINSTEILIGGRFEQYIMFGTDCRNLAKLNLKNKRLESIGVMNGDVTSVETYSNNFFIGGNFNQGELKHFARITSFVGVNNLEKPENVNLFTYPNPAKNALNINLQNKDLTSLQVFDMQGKAVVQTGKILNKDIYSLDISSLKNGLYILKAVDNKGNVSSSKFEILK